ncbi:MAG: AbrB/MazE/SpoVT family DNA-binding domain-containing protein [Promethearchaeota archaeon]|nr:MAG: AbrB/MazE/SpoVT family DNA-binding domain-containing protein [Candidatus Lokiarchaeota archaeon]
MNVIGAQPSQKIFKFIEPIEKLSGDLMIVESRVGSKGELFLTKEIREKLGLNPGDTIFLEIKNNELIIRRTPDLLELLEAPVLGDPETPEKIEHDLENFLNIQLQKSDQKMNP